MSMPEVFNSDFIFSVVTTLRRDPHIVFIDNTHMPSASLGGDSKEGYNQFVTQCLVIEAKFGPRFYLYFRNKRTKTGEYPTPSSFELGHFATGSAFVSLFKGHYSFDCDEDNDIFLSCPEMNMVELDIITAVIEVVKKIITCMKAA